MEIENILQTKELRRRLFELNIDVHILRYSGQVFCEIIEKGTVEDINLFLSTTSTPKNELIEDKFNSTTIAHAAIRSKDYEMVKLITTTFPESIAKRDAGKHTILHHAVLLGDRKIIKYITGLNSKLINEVNHATMSAFDFALVMGDIEIVQYLITKGADVYHYRNYRIYTLLYAISSGNLELIQFIQNEYQINVEFVDIDNMNGLMLAASLSEVPINTNMFLQNIQNYLIPNKRRATIEERLGIVKYCVEDLHFSLKTNCELNEFYYAALGGSLEIFKYLIKIGSQIFKRMDDSFQRSVFFRAIKTGNIELVKEIQSLLGDRMDVTLPDSNGQNAFHHAVASGNVELLKYFQVYNFDYNSSKNIYFETPFMIAVASGRLECIRYLYETLHVDIYKSPMKSISRKLNAFWIAISEGNYECINYLLSIANRDLIFEDLNHKAYHAYILNRRYRSTFDSRVIKCLKEYGFNIHARDRNMKTPLIFALTTNLNDRILVPLIFSLLRNGSSVYALDNQLNSPLHYAIYRKLTPAVIQFIKLRALETAPFLHPHDRNSLEHLYHIGEDGYITPPRIQLQRAPFDDIKDIERKERIANWKESYSLLEILHYPPVLFLHSSSINFVQ